MKKYLFLSAEDRRPVEERKRFIDRVRKLQLRKNRETMLKDAMSVYPISMQAFDRNKYFFNCKNGTLDMRTLEFREHRPEDYLTMESGITYDPDADCTRWHSFIKEVMCGDADLADFLQRSLGYALTGDTSQECMFILYGATSRNGKGTAMETFLKIMGDYGKTSNPDMLAAKFRGGNTGGPSEEVARLVGSRFVNISEPEKKITFNAALVKRMTGNDTINARFLNENKEDDFDVESELKQPCFSKEGDLWHLGKHIVLCGDSTKAECYNTLMDGTKANLVLSDPPYNVDVEETAGKIMNDNMGDSEFYQFLLAAFQQMHDHLADDGSIYIFHADTEGLNFRKAFKDAGFYLSGCCIWKKNALVLGRSPYQWQHEPCLYGWKQKGKHQWYSDRKQTTIWEYDRPKSNKDHPTMKPIGLMSYPIRNSTMTNGIVLDPFLGSGSTLIACEETDRVCRGIELDPKFVDVIVKRYIEHSEGHYDDVYVIRDGQKLKFEEVATFEPESEDADA